MPWVKYFPQMGRLDAYGVPKQVELALKETDDPATVLIAHDAAKINLQRQRENLLARIGKP